MVPPYSDQVSRVWPYSGSCAAVRIFTYVTLTLFGWPSHAILLTLPVLKAVRTPKGFLLSVCPLPRSLATTYGISFDVSSSPYLDVSVQAVPLHTLWIGVWMIRVLRTGFPHSDICGSRTICISPQLFAAYHVLHRLLMPRHSPCALLRLTSSQLASSLICLRKFHTFRRLLLFPKNIVTDSIFWEPYSPHSHFCGFSAFGALQSKTISRSP